MHRVFEAMQAWRPYQSLTENQAFLGEVMFCSCNSIPAIEIVIALCRASWPDHPLRDPD